MHFNAFYQINLFSVESSRYKRVSHFKIYSRQRKSFNIVDAKD